MTRELTKFKNAFEQASGLLSTISNWHKLSSALTTWGMLRMAGLLREPSSKIPPLEHSLISGTDPWRPLVHGYLPI